MLHTRTVEVWWSFHIKSALSGRIKKIPTASSSGALNFANRQNPFHNSPERWKNESYGAQLRYLTNRQVKMCLRFWRY